jgi:hypothetical protein
MILQDEHQRVMLWGCKEQSNFLVAELAFFASNLRRTEVEVKNQDRTYLLRIESKYLNSNFPLKAQNLIFCIQVRE